MWNVVPHLVSGQAIFGGVAWGLDLDQGTSWILAAGILGNTALSL